MDKIIYFSGSHGSGKSTLIRELKNRYPENFIVYEKLEIPKNHDTYERTKIRLSRHYLQALFMQKISKENPKKLILADRCIYCDESYMKGFLRLGWVTNEQMDDYLKLQKLLITPEIAPKNIVYVNSSLKQTINNIKKRWEETGQIKWKEEDFNYLAQIKKGYEEKYSELDVLRITEPDLEKRINGCVDWFQKKFNTQLTNSALRGYCFCSVMFFPEFEFF